MKTSVPWLLLEPHEQQAMSNHGGQTLKVLASRGGLSPCEALAVVLDRPWTECDKEIALAVLKKLAVLGGEPAAMPPEIQVGDRVKATNYKDAVLIDQAHIAAWFNERPFLVESVERCVWRRTDRKEP